MLFTMVAMYKYVEEKLITNNDFFSGTLYYVYMLNTSLTQLNLVVSGRIMRTAVYPLYLKDNIVNDVKSISLVQDSVH
jgi:hypothetical protein